VISVGDHRDDFPAEVIVFGQRFRVSIGDPGLWSGDAMGRCSIRAGEILLNGKMGRDAALSTLLHEAIHAALDITAVKMPDGQMEPLVGILEAFMFSFIRDNGNLVAKIAEL